MDDVRTDEGLMLAYQGGDVAAFETLYSRWRGPLYRFFLRQCPHAGEADELFQDTMMRVIGAASGYQPTAKFSTFLFQVARNRLIDHWRKTGRQPVESLTKEIDGEDCDIDPPAPARASPERQTENRQLGEALLAAVGELPDVQREAFLLAEGGDMTLEEIAAMTGVGRETVKSRLRYATAKLRATLKEWQ